MVARFRSWWKNTSKTLDAVVILMLVVLIVLVVVIILGYTNNWSWAGLRGKTLYDWLQLLIIPAVLAVGGYLFNYTTGRTEREITSDRQQEEALQAYIDSLSALLLEKNLRKSEDDEVRRIARVQTLKVLPRLDGRRKRGVLQFLYETGLINSGKRIVDLYGADLSEVNLFRAYLDDGADLSGANLRKADLEFAAMRRADLSQADLHGAYLRGANLVEANLREAILSDADLSGVYLTGADLTEAIVNKEQLNKSKSLKGATMPDGTIHH